MNPEKIFFSYSRSDSEFALKLGKDLREKGINIWLDQLDIPPGSTWDIEVENALNTSDCILILLSPDSVASKNVMDEINFGIEEKKKVIPVLIRYCKIPFRLRRLQFIDFSKIYEQGLSRLLNTFEPESSLDKKIIIEKEGRIEKIRKFISGHRYAFITAGLLIITFFTWIIIRQGNHTITVDNNKANESLLLLIEQQRKDSLQNEQELKHN
jgi:TIR domain